MHLVSNKPHLFEKTFFPSLDCMCAQMKEELMHRFPQKTSKEVIRRLEAKQLIRSSSVDSASHRKSHDCCKYGVSYKL